MAIRLTLYHLDNHFVNKNTLSGFIFFIFYFFFISLSFVMSSSPKRKSPTSSMSEPASKRPHISPPLAPLPPPLMQYPSVVYYPPYYPIPSPTPASSADERERARKVSHSAIERRRRERINDKIHQLKQLIPYCAEQENLHKMSILQSAIDYIAYLKDVVKSIDDDDALLHGADHVKIKVAKSMLPKEVEPFTTQFSVKQVNTIKPPLTPPQESKPTNKVINSSPEESKHMSLQNILC